MVRFLFAPPGLPPRVVDVFQKLLLPFLVLLPPFLLTEFIWNLWVPNL